MKIISFDEPINISKTHKQILDERILEANKNPKNYITFDELLSSLNKKVRK